MKKKIIISMILLTVTIFFASEFYNNLKYLCEYINTNANGRIIDLRYNTQTLIEIKLNTGSDWIYLGTDVTYDIKIEKGDSICKKIGDYKTILVKNSKSYNISSERYILKYLNCDCITHRL
jgi:hypothetical protein